MQLYLQALLQTIGATAGLHTNPENLNNMPALLSSTQPVGLRSALPRAPFSRPCRLLVSANAAKDPNAPIQSNPLGTLSSQGGGVQPVPRSEASRRYFRTVSALAAHENSACVCSIFGIKGLGMPEVPLEPGQRSATFGRIRACQLRCIGCLAAFWSQHFLRPATGDYSAVCHLHLLPTFFRRSMTFPSGRATAASIAL